VETLEVRLLPTAGAFLQGTAFLDANQNKMLDPAETYLSGATIQLKNLGGTVLATTTTDANGAYRFDDSNVPGGLSAGTYQLVETPPAGYANEDVQIQSLLSPASRVDAKTIQVTIIDPTQILDHFDKDGPGLHDSITFNNQVMSGLMKQFIIHLTGPGLNTSQFDSLCVDLVNNVAPGDVYAVLPTPAISGLPNGGRIAYLYNHYGQSSLTNSQAEGLQLAIWKLQYDGNFSANPNAPQDVLNNMNFYLSDSVGKSEQAVFLDSTLGGKPGYPLNGEGQGMLASGSLNFANVQQVTIADFVWQDTNGNGLQEAGEPGIQNVTLTLTGTNAFGGAVTDHATTDSTGHYLFAEVPGT
jgi:hypothetical protein